MKSFKVIGLLLISVLISQACNRTKLIEGGFNENPQAETPQAPPQEPLDPKGCGRGRGVEELLGHDVLVGGFVLKTEAGVNQTCLDRKGKPGLGAPVNLCVSPRGDVTFGNSSMINLAFDQKMPNQSRVSTNIDFKTLFIYKENTAQLTLSVYNNGKFKSATYYRYNSSGTVDYICNLVPI